MTWTCPNCSTNVTLEGSHQVDVCVLALIAGLLIDSGTAEATVNKLQENCDIDMLWNDLDKILTRFEGGEYNNLEPEETDADE